ncbi:MAG: hypothetical protein KAR19_13020 [Bacteroidales bacterium]|nr:hypothetical protein [Bacteroidales bacterium]
MEVKIIKTMAEYDTACERLYALIHSSEDLIPENSPIGEEMELLAILIEQYEREHYSMGAPDPIEAIKFQMEQMDLKQVDIAPLFGGKTRVSEVLNRKRPLSLKMIILLNRYLGIPLESLITGKREVHLNKSEQKKVMESSAIREYLNSNPGRLID